MFLIKKQSVLFCLHILIYLFGKIKKEKEFEIKAATTQERIHKYKKLALLPKLMQASVSVMKNVVSIFFKNFSSELLLKTS